MFYSASSPVIPLILFEVYTELISDQLVVGEEAECASQLFPQLACIRASTVWMKALIMTAGPVTVKFRREQQLLGVAAH